MKKTKTVLVTLVADIPDTELSKPATVTVEGRTYNGIVKAIVTHEELPSPATITLEGAGLKVATPP